MRAIRLNEYGSVDKLKLENIPRPEPKDKEILIKVHAAGINPVDWKIIEGKASDKFPIKLPITPGWDLAGVIEEVGKSVKSFRAGDEVFCKPDLDRDGAYAEFIVVPEHIVSYKPTNISFTDAASVPLAGLTAWQGLFQYGNLKKGEKVLIHAASGGVGSLAVQFAKSKGAYVIGTCSTDNVSFVNKLGADEVIDYTKQNFEDDLKEIDLVFDTIGGETQQKSLLVLKEGGRLISIVGAQFEQEAKAKNIRLEAFMSKPNKSQLDEIAALIQDGSVIPAVSGVYSLEETAQALRESANGHVRGKLVLRVF
ncbi:NADPH:quinone reductase-like Zn-dependent oxidoreductase [Pedobacter sp. UYP30]|uniref:NADP-dependent oxidoreductase n=1 Tax=Pedobacter sp. UYP30 TaxID=1756400 RepID=UPI00339669C9